MLCHRVALPSAMIRVCTNAALSLCKRDFTPFAVHRIPSVKSVSNRLRSTAFQHSAALPRVGFATHSLHNGMLCSLYVGYLLQFWPNASGGHTCRGAAILVTAPCVMARGEATTGYKCCSYSNDCSSRHPYRRHDRRLDIFSPARGYYTRLIGQAYVHACSALCRESLAEQEMPICDSHAPEAVEGRHRCESADFARQ